jgi:hypothetical protein
LAHDGRSSHLVGRGPPGFFSLVENPQTMLWFPCDCALCCESETESRSLLNAACAASPPRHGRLSFDGRQQPPCRR